MPASSKTTFIHERHSFVSGKQIENRGAPKRIPRPPNAFMLYRSDFLKRRAVPPEVEKRQQNLSRIAGQCWNMLPEAEKAIWYDKSAVVRAEHHAKYHSHKIVPFPKDTSSLSITGKKKGGAANVGCRVGRFRTRRTQTPYCEGMFAALRDSGSSSPVSQASSLSPTLGSLSPLSTTASLSPLSLPHLLPPFISYTHPNTRELPPATSESPTIWKIKIGPSLDPFGPETLQRRLSQLIRDLETTPTEIGSAKESFSPLERYDDDVATRVPHADFDQLLESQSNPVAHVSPTSTGPGAPSPERCHTVAGPSLAHDFRPVDDFAHFEQSLLPLYLSHCNEADSSGRGEL